VQLAGALMLAFGITAKVDKHAVASIFDSILPSQSREELDDLGVNLSDIVASNSTFMIVLGIVIILIATFGFVGACCMVRWMLVVVSRLHSLVSASIQQITESIQHFFLQSNGIISLIIMLFKCFYYSRPM